MLRSNKFIYRPCERCGNAFPKQTKRQRYCLSCKKKIYALAGKIRRERIYDANASPRWFSKKVDIFSLPSIPNLNSLMKGGK